MPFASLRTASRCTASLAVLACLAFSRTAFSAPPSVGGAPTAGAPVAARAASVAPVAQAGVSGRTPRNGRPDARVWRRIADGVEYAVVQAIPKPGIGDGRFHLVRIDPSRAPLRAGVARLDGKGKRTAEAWSREEGMAVVFNAGMFDLGDHLTHAGRFHVGAHVNSDAWIGRYKSLLVQRCAKARPGAQCTATVEDADREPVPMPSADLLVQNLRLIRHPGENVWPVNRRRWSETALASLEDGRLLVVFSRTPLTMRDFNERLLGLGLGVRAAMHLEGGPEASLSIHGGGVEVDLAGSYETGFNEDDTNESRWPVPNVLGVGTRSAQLTPSGPVE